MGLNILHLLQELEGTYAINDSASSRDANYETTHFILKSRNIGATSLSSARRRCIANSSALTMRGNTDVMEGNSQRYRRHSTAIGPSRTGDRYRRRFFWRYGAGSASPGLGVDCGPHLRIE